MEAACFVLPTEIVRVIKSRRMRQARQVARMGKEIKHTVFLLGKPEADRLEDLSRDGG